MAEGPVATSSILLSTLVELSVSAKNLKSKDAFSKSDAVCILYMKDPKEDLNIEIARTEEIKNNPNPEWMKKFELEYKFEEKQILLFRIYDWDTKSTEVKGQDLIGEIEYTLAEIMTFQGKEVSKQLPKKSGTLSVVGQEVSGCKEVVTISFSAEKLDKKDTFGKSDPFLVLSRVNKDESTSPVHKTEFLKNTLNPTWQPVAIRARTLCRGNYDQKFKIECFDWDSNEKCDLIGECFATLTTLKDSKAIALINPKKATKSKYTNSGMLTAQIQSIHEDKSFLDYIRQGVQLHFTISVDFTASNGNPKEPGTLHYLEPEADNAYTTAMKAVGYIIKDYDTDQMIPALGFGARVPPNTKVSHEFYMNGSPEDPYCKGITGVLEAYKSTLEKVELFGPTNFAPSIKHVGKFSKVYSDGKHYFILLIITDGVISDLPETMNALIDASFLPMSVIIVGVGDEDFSAMKILDADGKKLSYEGRESERDIVQFIDFNKYFGKDKNFAKNSFTRDVLKEIPNQMVAYMRKINK